MPFKEITHKIGYFAIKTHWPNGRIMSKAYMDIAGDYSDVLNANPSYASNFLVLDTTAVDKADQLTCVWTIFTSYDKEDPNTGMVKVSETMMRNIVSDFYLYSNLNITAGFYAKPKVRIIIIVKAKTSQGEQVLFSRPLKMSDLVSWHGNGELAFESEKMATAYAEKVHIPTSIDPRPVMPGHFYNLLRSHDYLVQTQSTGTELIYLYPFDFSNPADRHNRKTDPDYLYSSALNMCYKSSVLMEHVASVNNCYNTVGVVSHKGVKGLHQISRTPQDIKDMHKIVDGMSISDAIFTIKDQYKQFLLFPDYTWYQNTPLSNAAKELI